MAVVIPVLHEPGCPVRFGPPTSRCGCSAELQDDAGAFADLEVDLPPGATAHVVLGVVLRGAAHGGQPRTDALGRGLGALTQGGGPARRPDGTRRGLAALIPDDAETLTPDPPRSSGPETVGGARERRPAAEGRRQLEAYWLVTPTTGVLHHAPLSDEQAVELAVHEWVDHDERAEPITLTCERTAWTVVRPTAVQRRSTARCEECAAALGYPGGFGGPVNAPACTAVLSVRLRHLLPDEPTPGEDA